MPTFGDISGDPELPRAIGIYSRIPIAGDGHIRWDVTSVTFDDTKSQQFVTQDEYSLHDMVGGNAWRLRRIVGKLWAHWYRQPSEEGKQPPLIDYAAGFIVGKSDDEGSATADFDEVNPLAQEGSDDPWIWRRRWLLSTGPEKAQPSVSNYNTFSTNQVNVEDYYDMMAYPSSTAYYGSVADGPHIDQKTARVIDRQERLLFVQAARYRSLGGELTTYAAPGELISFLDYRLVGSIRSSAPGNRRNASR